MEFEPISKDDLELLCSNVTESVPNLLTVGVHIFGLTAVLSSVLTEDFWNVMARLVLLCSLVLGVRVGIVVPFR